MARIKTNKILVIDIESTCWEGGDQPTGQISEIIEIGTALLDIRNEVCTEINESIIVKPIFSTVSKFCTELTTLTQDIVDKGIDFEAACEILYSKYNSKHIAWASWGEYDKNMFIKQVNRGLGPMYPFSNIHINIKELYALFNKCKAKGMRKAYNETFGRDISGILHRGKDDAANIAEILGFMINSYRKGKLLLTSEN